MHNWLLIVWNWLLLKIIQFLGLSCNKNPRYYVSVSVQTADLVKSGKIGYLL